MSVVEQPEEEPVTSDEPVEVVATETVQTVDSSEVKADEAETAAAAAIDEYPRDMKGYGPSPPTVKWPNNARLAISFVLNLEEGSEYNILHGDTHSESFLCESIDTVPLEHRRNLVAESCYQYGSKSGVWRILRLFSKYGIKSTVFANGMSLERNPEVASYMVKMGHEVASHGYRWINYRGVKEEQQKADLLRCIEVQKRVCNGSEPLGVYLGRFDETSKKLVTEVGNFKYCSDCYDDDLPYWDVTTNPQKPMLMIPYSLDTNDYRYLVPHGFIISDHFWAYLKDAFDTLYEEGGRMMSIGIHARISGHPGRMAGLEKFIRYITSNNFKNRVWVTRRIDIAHFWEQHFPVASTQQYREGKVKVKK